MKPKNLAIIVILFILVLGFGIYLGKGSNQPTSPDVNKPATSDSNASQVPQPVESSQITLEEAISADLTEAEKQAAASLVRECYEFYYADQEKLYQETKEMSVNGNGDETMGFMADYNLSNRKLAKERFVDPQLQEYLNSQDRRYSPVTYPLDPRLYFFYLEPVKAFSFEEAARQSDVFISIARKDLGRVIQEDGEEIKARLAEYHQFGYEKYAVIVVEYKATKVLNHYDWREENWEQVPNDNNTVISICGLKNNNWYILP